MSICIVRYEEEEWEHDAANNPYAIPYVRLFCGKSSYLSGENWKYFVYIDDYEDSTCGECLESYALHILSELP